MQIRKNPGLGCFQMTSTSWIKTTLFIIMSITKNQDEMDVFHSKGKTKVYFLHSSIILLKAGEKNPGLFCRESYLKGEMNM